MERRLEWNKNGKFVCSCAWEPRAAVGARKGEPGEHVREGRESKVEQKT